jgi:hypothetical protein
MLSYRLREGGVWSQAIPAGTFEAASIAIAKARDARPAVSGWEIFNEAGEFIAGQIWAV